MQKQLGADGSEWCRNKDVVVDKKQSVIFEKAGNSTDSALAAVFVPTGYDEYTSSAYSSLLGQIVQPGSTISCVPKNSWAMPCLRFQ